MAAAGCCFAAAGLTTFGCTDGAEAPTASDPTSIARAKGETTPAAPAWNAIPYRPIDALCAKLDLRSVADIIGPVGSRQDTSRTGGSTVNLACVATVGRLLSGAVVTVRVDIGGPDSGRLMYEGLRQAQQDSGPLTDLTGVGVDAYTAAT